MVESELAQMVSKVEEGVVYSREEVWVRWELVGGTEGEHIRGG